MPKQTKSSNNTALKGFALTLVILILAVCVMAAMTEGFTNWNPYGWFDKPAEEQQTPEGDDPAPEQPTEEPAPIEATISNSKHIALAMSAAVTAADGEYVEQTLTATVTPSTAEELGVDWTVAWADGSDSPTLSDYLTITPASDGSNICYVRAYASFDKDIIITCTTRDGGFTATCTVKFVGNPSEVLFDASGLEPETDAGWGVNVYKASTSGNYSIGISLDNFFHKVDPSFVPNYTLDVKAVGTINVRYTSNEGANEVYEQDLNGEYYNDGSGRKVLSDLITYQISDGTLVIDPVRAVNALTHSRSLDGGRTRRYWNFESYTDSAKIPYFEFKVTETNTGLTQTINIRIISGVNGVSLDHSSITF